jgi:hypothetical protein
MRYRFTQDDIGKDVVTSEDDRIGTIDGVDEDRATVDREEDVDPTEKVRDLLGWGDGDETHVIYDEHVERSLNGEIHLRRH